MSPRTKKALKRKLRKVRRRAARKSLAALRNYIFGLDPGTAFPVDDMQLVKIHPSQMGTYLQTKPRPVPPGIS